MKSKINYYWWYLFFSSYWTAYELGEKNKPEENAKYFIGFIIGLNMFALFQILLLYGIQVNTYIFVPLCFLTGIIIVNRIYFHKNRYIKMKESFLFLQNSSNKSKRYKVLFLTAIWSIAFVAAIAVMRDIYNTL